MLTTVSALYVDPRGPYPKLVEDWWDETRNAKLYDGPNPVVAHPPCGPWGIMRHLCKHQDRECGPRAVEQVRKWGGVLEHPRHSTLFDACALPLPGELSDGYGFTIECNQVAWGHCCEKPTWLYFVGLSTRPVVRVGGRATHRVTSGPRGPKLPSASKQRRIHSPPAFAEWLVSLAAQVAEGKAA